MIKKKFCEYCGAPLNERCGCLREIAEYEEGLYKELVDRPETQYGWHRQDIIENGHFYQK